MYSNATYILQGYTTINWVYWITLMCYIGLKVFWFVGMRILYKPYKLMGISDFCFFKSVKNTYQSTPTRSSLDADLSIVNMSDFFSRIQVALERIYGCYIADAFR